jgi:Ca-activated chloride channel family protein
VSTQGSDLVLVFDCSKSMDTRDVPPSRLVEAKREALALLDDLEGDRVAVVAFAGDAAALTPLTLDLSAVRLLVTTLDTDALSTPGTDLGKGLTTALRVLPEGDSGEQAVVLFTDGEDLEGHLDEAAALARRRGVKVFPVGMGTAAGQTIPVLDDNGRQVGVKTDESGQPVVSKVDHVALEGLARKTGGRAFTAQHPGGQLTALRAALATVGRGARQGRLGSRPVERFFGFALLAWLLLVASWLLPERTAVRKGHGRAEEAAALLLVAGLAGLGLLVPARALAAPPLVEGNRRYDAGDAGGAIKVYQEALKKHPNDPALWNNLGAALYKAGKYPEAEQAFNHIAAKDARTQGLAAYGRGDALYQQEKYREALAAFREALERRPGDADARHNYEATLRKLVAPKSPDQPPPPQQQPPPPNPQSGAGGGGGGGGGAGAPPPPAGGTAQPPPSSPTPEAGHMSKDQAERLLDALDAGERQARAAQKKRQGGEERRGKDW